MRTSGTLIFRVYTSDANLPVEGATVVVQQQRSPERLLGLRITNSSGETDPIVIEAPDSELSQTPENTVQPWTGVRALVEHSEYEKVVLEGLQIFPGIETVQNIQLTPLREFDPQLSGQENFYFTPQPVWEGASNE